MTSQRHFRFRTDTGAADATPTWGANEDSSTFTPGASPFRLRLSIENPTHTATGSLPYQIYLSKNGGAYSAITTSSTNGIKSADAGSDADNTSIFVPRLTVPAWTALAGAAIDLDFANDHIYPSGAFSDYLSVSRASDGYAKNSSGDWVQFSSNVLRITDLGLLVEDARTNYLLNSGSPATQETESLATGDYTLWVEGSGSAIASNGTGTITGAESATEGSPSVFTVTVAGTVNVTVTGSLDRFQLEKGGFSSSYIPTGAVTATRASDEVLGISSLQTLITGSAASIFIDTILNASLSTYGRSAVWVSANNGTLVLAENSNDTQISLQNEGYCNFASGSYLTGAKIACAYDGSGGSVVGNGGTVGSGANVLDTTSPIALGSRGGIFLFGYIRRLAAWSSRLSNVTLQSLTT